VVSCFHGFIVFVVLRASKCPGSFFHLLGKEFAGVYRDRELLNR